LYMELRQEFPVNNPRIYPGAGASPLSFYPVRVAFENEGIRQLLRSWNFHCIASPQIHLGVIYRQRLGRFMHKIIPREVYLSTAYPLGSSEMPERQFFQDKDVFTWPKEIAVFIIVVTKGSR
jgi:hypothetical protein